MRGRFLAIGAFAAVAATLSAAIAAAIAVAIAATAWGGGMAAPAFDRHADMSKADDTNVDVELVIAVDVSYSMDPDEQALQRDGYVTALTSPEFLNALRSGPHGKVAITSITRTA